MRNIFALAMLVVASSALAMDSIPCPATYANAGATCYVQCPANTIHTGQACKPKQAPAPIETCAAGLVMKPGGGCVSLMLDPNNCGRFDNKCGAGQTCTAGACVCPAGFVVGPGQACFNLMADANNCGKLGNKCAAGQNCLAGKCR